MSKTTKGWTPERRAAQAERARQNKPWQHSTGPRSAEGKARSSQNGTTHGLTGAGMRALRDALGEHRSYLALLNLLDTARHAARSRPPDSP